MQKMSDRISRIVILALISLCVVTGCTSVNETATRGDDPMAATQIELDEPDLRQVPLDRVAELARGVHHTRINPDGLTFSRLPDSMATYLDKRNEVWGVRARCTAGVCLAFVSDTRYLRLELAFEPGIREADAVTVSVDGALVRRISPSESRARPGKVIELPRAGEKRLIEVFLASTCPTLVQGLAIDAETKIDAAPTRPVLLALGDSITQGGYPDVAARLLGMTVHNAGIGGHFFDPGSLTEPVVDSPALITVAFGTNDWAGGRDPENARAYLDRLRAFWPDTPVVVLQPIFRSKPPADADSPTPNKYGLTLGAYREQLTEIADQYDNTTVLATKLLLPGDPGLLADGIHPTARGCMIMGQNLAALLRPIIDPGPKPLDGIDILRRLSGEDTSDASNRMLSFQKNRYTPVAHSDAAIRQGRWKLYWPGEVTTMTKDIGRNNPSYERGMVSLPWEMPIDAYLPDYHGIKTEPPELYDLVNDPSELHDLAATHPERVRQLASAYDQWFTDVFADWRLANLEVRQHDKQYWQSRNVPDPAVLFKDFWQWHRTPGTDPTRDDPLEAFTGYWNYEDKQ